MEDIFPNKHVEECKVHAWEDEVCVVLELSSPSGMISVVQLQACSFLPDAEHRICHAFLSAADSGVAIDAFPKDVKITGVCRVKRTEPARRWSCSGCIANDECDVSGIKFSFKRAASATP